MLSGLYKKECTTVYHFHHIDPNSKAFGISHKIRKYKKQKVYEELDKCKLLCANCHGEIHDILYEKQRQQTISSLKQKETKISQNYNNILNKCIGDKAL